MIALHIASTPPFDVPGRGLPERTILSVSSLRQSLGQEVGSVSVELDNTGGRLWRDLTPVPYQADAHLSEEGQIIFAGQVRGLSQRGAVLTVTLEAAGSRSLATNLPLRRTTAWTAYQEDAVIPVGYGELRSRPIRYDAEGYLWVLCDHPVGAVYSVTDADEQAVEFRAETRRDDTDRPVTVIETTRPLTEAPTVHWLGKLHRTTGAPLLRPAEIMGDLLGQVIGYTLPNWSLAQFGRSLANTECGYLLDDDTVTARSVITQFCESIGAVWTQRDERFAVVYPRSDTPVPNGRLQYCTNGEPATTIKDLATAMVLVYDYDHATGQYARSLRAEAPKAISRYGLIEARHEAPWLRRPDAAADLVSRLLQHRARPIWTYTCTASERHYPGDWLILPDDIGPIDGIAMCTQSDPTPGVHGGITTVEAPAGDAPAVQITHQATQERPIPPASASVEAAGDGQVLVTIKADGRRLIGARVSINGGPAQTTDANGQIRVTGSPGTYTLTVDAAGYAPFTLTTTL